MILRISRPELLAIADEGAQRTYFGGDQAWFQGEWHRRAGCGPTCAANQTAYLALTRPELRGLYAGADMGKAAFSAHMEEIYRFVTPGSMGLNRLEPYVRGVEEFAAQRGLRIRPHVFEVYGNMFGERPPAAALADFVRAGLESDSPIGFLNLTRGRVKNIQGWHWVTITAAELSEDLLIASASDEGQEIRFDLRLWYLSTRMRGGLIYFT